MWNRQTDKRTENPNYVMILVTPLKSVLLDQEEACMLYRDVKVSIWECMEHPTLNKTQYELSPLITGDARLMVNGD